MAEFSYTKDGIKLHGRYTTKGVPTLKSHIYPNAKATASLLTRKKGRKGMVLCKVYKAKDNSELVRMIFDRFMLKLLEKVADGHLVKFPGITGAYIALKKVPDKEVKRLRQNGYYKNFDIAKAGYTIPRFSFDFGPRSRRRDVQIYVGSTLLQRALRNAEKGILSYPSFLKKKEQYDSRVERDNARNLQDVS